MGQWKTGIFIQTHAKHFYVCFQNGREKINRIFHNAWMIIWLKRNWTFQKCGTPFHTPMLSSFLTTRTPFKAHKECTALCWNTKSIKPLLIFFLHPGNIESYEMKPPPDVTNAQDESSDEFSGNGGEGVLTDGRLGTDLMQLGAIPTPGESMNVWKFAWL